MCLEAPSCALEVPRGDDSEIHRFAQYYLDRIDSWNHPSHHTRFIIQKSDSWQTTLRYADDMLLLSLRRIEQHWLPMKRSWPSITEILQGQVNKILSSLFQHVLRPVHGLLKPKLKADIRVISGTDRQSEQFASQPQLQITSLPVTRGVVGTLQDSSVRSSGYPGTFHV